MLGFEIILDGVALLTTTQEKNREWLELKKILWGQPIVVNKLKQTQTVNSIKMQKVC